MNQRVDLSTLEGQLAHYAAVRARIVMAGARYAERSPQPVAALPATPVRVPRKADEPPKLTRDELEAIKRRQRADELGQVAGSTLWRRLLEYCCVKHDLGPLQILSQRRHKPLAFARQELWWLASKLMRLSQSQLGQLSGRDHTTVMFGLRQHERRNPHLRLLGESDILTLVGLTSGGADASVSCGEEYPVAEGAPAPAA